MFKTLELRHFTKDALYDVLDKLILIQNLLNMVLRLKTLKT